jgi:circadian clock protein KaiC
VTLLAESHGKLVDHLRDFTFFDETIIGKNMTVLNGYQSLRGGGPDGLLELLTSLMTEQHTRLLLVEGFSALRTMQVPQLDIAHFVHQLNAMVTTLGCTAILVDPSPPRVSKAEESLVDGILELTVHTEGARVERELQMHKHRAANPLLGRHAFRITDDGLRVFPRLEAAVARRAKPATETHERAPFGVTELDTMMHGGPLRTGTTGLFGPPGSGKTLLGLQFLGHGAVRNEKVMHFGFYESPARLIEKADRVGIGLQGALDAGLLQIVWQPPLEYAVDELAYKLLETLQQHQPRRLVIDGLDGFLQSAVRKERFGAFLTALMAEIRGFDVDVVLTKETELARWQDLQFPVSTALIENIILLRYGDLHSRLQRLISIVKMRGSEYDPTVRELRISSAGLHAGRAFHGIPATSADTPQRSGDLKA